MKIERINENQIRCTLTGADLASRQIELGELAYGSDKARRLFRDMMTQARARFGFDSESSPLMIEAIPLSTDSIVLVITKVDDPEELDTRFSRFTDSGEGVAPEARHFAGADSILDLFRTIADAKNQETPQEVAQEPPADCPLAKHLGEEKKKQRHRPIGVNLVQAFLFSSLDDVIAAARGLDHYYGGKNSLFKTPDGDFQLVVHQSGCAPEKFNKVCNILSEYGTNMNFVPAGEAYLAEHGDLVIGGDAVQKLSVL